MNSTLRRDYNKFMLKKLKALKKIGKHLGMYGKLKKEPQTVDCGMVIMSLKVLISDKTTLIQKTACGFILDYYIPDWRDNAPDYILAPVLSRNDKEVREWKERVLVRDNYKCVNCGSDKNLEAHHIVPWSEAPRLRIDVDNGETLCTNCHAKEHEGLEKFILAKVI